MPLTQICTTRETREGWPRYSLLKLRWMGTQRVQMKGILLWLVRWAYRAGTKYFCPALAALVGPVQNICFPYPTLFHSTLYLFHFICPHVVYIRLFSCWPPCQFNQLKDGDGTRSGFWKLMKLALMIWLQGSHETIHILSGFWAHKKGQ